MLGNIVQSTARFTALGKYLTALAASFADLDKGKATKREPSVKRKRLHLLYLLNDVLHHCKYRSSDASICSKVQPMLVDLFGSAGAFKDCPKHQAKLASLLDLWEGKGYYSKDYISKLRETVRNALEAGQHGPAGISAQTEDGIPLKNAKSAPYVMPATHGDTSTPWFDLPAGNLMPHIIPNSTRPINPDLVKPLQFVAGPAEERLASAVKDLLEDVHLIFGGGAELDDAGSRDIDELGQRIILDEVTGEVIDGEGYYGWSKSFCEKMKRRKNGPDPSTQDHARLSRSSSRSRSPSPGIRKRRYSDDGSSSPEEFRRMRRRRSYSSSRSPSPGLGRRNGHSKPNSRGRSRSISPKRSPDHKAQAPRSFPPPPPENFPPRPPMPSMSQPPFQQAFNPNFPPPPPPQLHNMSYNPQAQQYNQWVPPPPPFQQTQHMPFNPQQGPPFSQWPPPPPPPSGPPPPMNYQQQQYPPQQPQYQQQQPQYQQQPQHGQQYPSAPAGGWQQGAGRGFNGGNSGGWNNAPRGRGGYRGGRGW